MFIIIIINLFTNNFSMLHNNDLLHIVIVDSRGVVKPTIPLQGCVHHLAKHSCYQLLTKTDERLYNVDKWRAGCNLRGVTAKKI